MFTFFVFGLIAATTAQHEGIQQAIYGAPLNNPPVYGEPVNDNVDYTPPASDPSYTNNANQYGAPHPGEPHPGFPEYPRYPDQRCRDIKHKHLHDYETRRPIVKYFKSGNDEFNYAPTEYAFISCPNGETIYNLVTEKRGEEVDLKPVLEDHISLFTGLNGGILAKCDHYGRFVAQVDGERVVVRRVSCVETEKAATDIKQL